MSKRKYNWNNKKKIQWDSDIHTAKRLRVEPSMLFTSGDACEQDLENLTHFTEKRGGIKPHSISNHSGGTNETMVVGKF